MTSLQTPANRISKYFSREPKNFLQIWYDYKHYKDYKDYKVQMSY